MTEIEVFHLDRAVAAGHWQGGHGLHGDDFIKGDSEATGESVGFRVKQESFHRLSRGQELEFKFEEGKAGACRVGYGELVLESILWPDEAAQGTHNSASTFKTTGDVAGALRHAPAFSITSTDVTTLAHVPVTHNTLYKDTYRK